MKKSKENLEVFNAIKTNFNTKRGFDYPLRRKRKVSEEDKANNKKVEAWRDLLKIKNSHHEALLASENWRSGKVVSYDSYARAYEKIGGTL